MGQSRKRTWITGFLIFAAVMFGISALVFSSWSDLRTVDANEARSSFADLLGGAASGPAYLDVSAAGEMVVRRELEGDEPSELDFLGLLAWDAAQGRLLRIEFPFWFVRVKSSDTINLGTLVSAALHDWDHLDLRVTASDLALRGPGLVFDRTRPDGARLMLWLE